MKTVFFRTMLFLLLCHAALAPAGVTAGTLQIPGLYGKIVTPPAATQLPQLKQPSLAIPGVSGMIENAAQNQLVIRQNAPKAIIDWQSFNIGADSSVAFRQGTGTPGTEDWKPDSSYVALNRIWDASPSLIFGKLSSDGKVYLINQNGILFGSGSAVNVHTLMASALNMRDSDFLTGVSLHNHRALNFLQEDYQGRGLNRLATVSNHGEIAAAEGGNVFLIAPRLENAGTITAPTGQVGLIAGTDVTLVQPDADDLSGLAYYVMINDDFSNPSDHDPSFGKSVNLEGGKLYADGGVAGMYGNSVEQLGIIRSVTAYKNNRGQVELRAAGRIATGADSLISLPVDQSLDPETGRIVTVSDTFDIQPVVDIKGLREWSSAHTIVDSAPVKRIELRGVIEAPTGIVTLDAGERAFLDAGSRIDVSGVTAELPMPMIVDFKLNSVELRDSYGQKDGILPGEKITTSYLAGSTIGDLSQVILTRERTALERSIGGARRTVINPTTGYVTYNNPQTGMISIAAEKGDIIVKQGAVLDFSGGAVNYQGGFQNTTKLLSGNTIYDISNAPLYLHYDKILGQDANTCNSYVNGYTQGGDAGQLVLSAAAVVLDGRLNGGVTSGIYQNIWTMLGAFSGVSAGSDYDQAIALSVHRGLEAPRAGIVRVLTAGNDEQQGRGSSILLLSGTEPPKDILPDTPLATKTTTLSAGILNDADLSRIELTADLAISTGADAVIALQPGGSFSAQARRIDHQGEITVPAGSINLIIGQNRTSEKLGDGNDNLPGEIIAMQEPERIVLASTSRLDVSGERIDNSWAGKTGTGSLRYGQTAGGDISILDKTDKGDGAFIPSGAVVDVSGGYAINQNGKAAGGNAGTLRIQGANIMLDGDLRGAALGDTGGKILGGSIILDSKEIHVASRGDDWSGFNPLSDAVTDSPGKREKGKLYLTGNRFDETGFTQISLRSCDDTVIEPGIATGTSLVRLGYPISSLLKGLGMAGTGDAGVGKQVTGSLDFIRLYDSMAHMAGPSSFVAAAGNDFDGSNEQFQGNLMSHGSSAAGVVVSSGAVIATAPYVPAATRLNGVAANPASVKTGITLTGPYVEVGGTLDSAGGNILASAWGSIGSSAALGSLVITEDARILAGGKNRPDPASTPNGSSLNYLTAAGGSVSLSAYNAITLTEGSFIDISGSNPVETRMISTGGNTVAFREAGDPGSFFVSFGGQLTWSGSVKAQNPAAALEGIRGSALILNQTQSDLTVGAADILRYTGAGFDDITLKSVDSVQFSGTIDAAAGAIGRKLTIDAPKIAGSGNDVALSAPYIVLTNRTAPLVETGEAAAGGFILSGEWVDVIGSILFSGYRDVTLQAARDIRLSEAQYNKLVKGGRLAATGNLSLDADRVYTSSYYSYDGSRNVIQPGLYSDVVVHADRKLTVQRSLDDERTGGLIYAAGGSLLVEGLEGVEVKKGGFLAAPLGTIKLSAPGQRVFLAEGSTLSTVGTADLAVNYGLIDDDNLWMGIDKLSLMSARAAVSGDSLPARGVVLAADTVIVGENAVVDAAGGGAYTAFKFQPGIEGSTDPLARANRYIVFKDNSNPFPGTAVYLHGGGGLSEGLYTLLPLDAKNPQNAPYAFLPGAYILELQKSASTFPLSGQAGFTKYGYPLVVGYSAVTDTTIRGTRPQVFSVRTAADVLTEGHYLQPEQLTSGDGGDITVQGKTAIIDGVFKAAPLNDYYGGGKLDLIGTNVNVHGPALSLSEGVDFLTPLREEITGILNIAASSFSGQGLREIALGDQTATDSITIREGSSLESPVISLSAKKTIAIESGVRVLAIAQTGLGEINLNSPTGLITVNDGAVLHASHAINLNSPSQDIQGELEIDHSALALMGKRIIFVPDEYVKTGEGVYITESLWKRYSEIGDIALISASDILFEETFAGDSQISLDGSLTFDAARILGLKEGGTSVTVKAGAVTLKNSGGSSAAAAVVNAGAFTIDADQITIGSGDILFGGFESIVLNSRGDVTLQGAGSISTGKGALVVHAARVATASLLNTGGGASTPVSAANFIVYTGENYLNDQNALAPANAVTIAANGLAPGLSPAPGGILEFWGTTIDIGGTVQTDGGTIRLTATGAGTTEGVFLRDGARILARGALFAPGGRIILSALKGRIDLAANSLIDVSAGGQGDAGLVMLSAPVQGVTMGGDAWGKATGGRGGSFVLDADRMDDFSALAGKLAAGGFTEAAELRARFGDVEIASGAIVAARSMKLIADGGGINVYGTITAQGEDGGGYVEIHAMGDVAMFSGSRIDASGSLGDAGGGDVLLASAGGYINLSAGSEIDVSASGAGLGGVVYLRAPRNGHDVRINPGGFVAGVSRFTVEAFRVYNNVSTVNSAVLAAWDGDNSGYMANAAAIEARLLGSMTREGWDAARLHLLPGVEARSDADITLAQDVNMTSLRYGGEPGVLTLRVADNLTINKNLVDHPTGMEILTDSSAQDSWAFRLAAGADVAGADPLSVIKGRKDPAGKALGDITIADGTLVYTESAPIRFASGNDTVIGAGTGAGYMVNGSIKYSLAAYDGPIRGYVGRDFRIAGGAVQTATGDITVSVGRDIQLNLDALGNLGAIRTTGQAAGEGALDQYWNYGGGGDITLDVGRYVGQWSAGAKTVAMDAFAWDRFTKQTLILPLQPGQSRPTKLYYGIFSASFETFYDSNNIKITPTTGIATMGGGNLSVRTGGDCLVQAGTFGAGDLTIYAGGNVKGRFASMDGQGEIHAMGNFGAYEADATQRVQIELFRSALHVTALGEIWIGAVLNPSLASKQIHYKEYGGDDFYHCTYSADTSISLNAGTDVTLAGKSPFYNNSASNLIQETILPATVNIEAGGDISLLNYFTLTSSPVGQLRLIAGGDLRGAELISGTGGKTAVSNQSHMLMVSDIAPEYWYGLFQVYGTPESWVSDRTVFDGTQVNNKHGFYKDAALQASALPLHHDDVRPIELRAGESISNLKLYFPKKAEVRAQGDILNITYEGQNIHPDDVSMIRAEGNISMEYVTTDANIANLQGLIQGGPGVFFLQAGGSIDLGTLKDGIQTIGNGRYSQLGRGESSLVVVSGYRIDKTADEVRAYFATLQKAGDDYSQLSSEGKLDEAALLLQETRSETIAPFLGEPSGEGDINMTVSQVGTSIGQSDIFMIAGRDLNLGKTALPISGKVNKTTGITTGGGGDINIFALRDVNVNESRVMTFYGGDITAWSDGGSIRAGRGSRTAVSASPPKVLDDGTRVFSPPAIGSGIRAVTYGENAPEPGNIHLFAPSGIIDAGEAEISGGRIVLAAEQVLNVQNIVFSAGSVGVSQPTTGTAGIGSLSGSGSLISGTSQFSQETAGLAMGKSGNVEQLIDNVVTRWLDVKVIDFILDENG